MWDVLELILDLTAEALWHPLRRGVWGAWTRLYLQWHRRWGPGRP